MSTTEVLHALAARRHALDDHIAAWTPEQRAHLADYLKRRGAEDILKPQPDLVDFTDGFAAGYRADSQCRAVLGSPAYRLGYLEGVQAATARRRRAAAPAGRNTRFLRFVLIGFVLGLLLGWGFVRSARADTLSDWRTLNEVCQGGAGVTSDKACTTRQGVGAQLRREGWFQGEHGVWVSPEHVATFYRVVRSYDAAARENTGTLDAFARGMMEDLRRALPPETIFALWNGRAGQILATTPYAAGFLMYGLPYLERTLSGRNDPRFRMVLRP